MGTKLTKPEPKYQDKEEHVFQYKEMVKRTTISNIQEHYELLTKIGSGTSAEVFKAKSKHTANFRAIKKVNREKSPNIQRILVNQFEILREIDHPNIIKMFEFYEEPKNFYIVTQLIKGKELFDVFQQRKIFDQKEAFSIFYQVFLAITYLHKNHIMHRDIKLENIIYDEQTKIIKLIDFGSAVTFQGTEPAQREKVGTISYIAPEVINKYYNMKCDIWSLGILLYILLSGNAPFSGKTNEETMSKINKDQVSFQKNGFENISKEAKDLISKMLQKKPDKRINLNEIATHPWTRMCLNSQQLLNEEHEFIQHCITNMKKFKSIKATEIQIGILIFMINFTLNTENEEYYVKSFNILDSKGDGVICCDELELGMVEIMDMPKLAAKKLAKEIMDKIDLNESSTIDFSEFMLASMDLRTIITNDNLNKAFNYIDTDNSKKLSIEEIKDKLGDNIADSYYRQLVKQFDENGDGQIDLSEFTMMMKQIIKDY